MFELQYLLAELQRRRGRTILTALGLGVGVGLVIAVTALSQGLDDAQQEVLSPLTGVGTEMSVSRPISIEVPDGGGLPQVSPEERAQLEEENADIQFDLEDLGDPGEEFEREIFFTREISFPESKVERIAALDGVAAVSPSLSLQLIRVDGTIPEAGAFGPPGGAFGPDPDDAESSPDGRTELGGFGFEPTSVTGVDTSEPDLGPLTAEQIVAGEPIGSPREIVISAGYAAEQDLGVGDRVGIGEERLEITGVAEQPIGGEAPDVYADLAALQTASDRRGRINSLQVRAADVSQVAAVAEAIESELGGAEVTTAEEVSERISGSLLDAQDLSSSLGTVLAIVSLLAAVLIASLLTLSSIAKRTREIGTLKAVGWRRSKVVRQIGGESLAQGLLGGFVGIVVGVGASALIGALGISLEASAAASSDGGLFGAFLGDNEIATGDTEVTLDAPLNAGLLALAVALSLLGGLIAGLVGGLRAASLSPSEALRSVE
ncbi:MAG TPA: ABC transporter permease [Solirubrobacterales bacterium]|nr:ABC transporter permease [Solirubrobacterales bacterium]